MDKLNRTKIMGFILSSSMAFSGLSYADYNSDNANNQNVTNNGTVATTNGAVQVVPDDKLKSMVNTALGDYSGKVQVEAKGGVVMLSGELPSDTDYEKVIILAESIKGVQNVQVDDLTVKDSNSPLMDTYITAKVKGLLIQKDMFGTDIPSWSMGVETKNGVVFLSGKVESDSKKQMIMQLVKSVNGVKSVDDQVQISSTTDNDSMMNGNSQDMNNDSNESN